MTFLDAKTLLVISPHLDDAVLSCGELLAQFPGTVVATIFTGIPPQAEVLTAWDAASGFASARQAVVSRREEDRHALAALSALPLWLDFYDSQYQQATALPDLADAIEKTISQVRPNTILFPAGLFHSDHALTHDASLSMLNRYAGMTWIMYEEASYRRIPGLLQRRLADLLRQGIQATPVAGGDGGKALLKREAVHCYASQLRALEHAAPSAYPDVFAPENYWRLAPAIDAES